MAKGMVRPWVAAAMVAGAWLLPRPVAACGPIVEIEFLESDGDLFIVANKSEARWTLLTLTMRLTGSVGALIFDTAEGGPGANMASPFAAVPGAVTLKAVPVVPDGAELLTMTFDGFNPGREFLFTIDVDDRLEKSDYGPAVISGSEITGAGAYAELALPGGEKAKAKGDFGPDGKARLRGALCT